MIPIRYNLRSLAVRKTTTIATGLGVALVVYVFASALMLAEGIRRTLTTSGSPNAAMVMRKGSDNELSSVVETPTMSLLLAAPGVKREVSLPLGAGEIVAVNAMEKIGANGISNVQLRGVTDVSLKLRPEFKIVEGKAPSPGSDEVLVGERIRGRFRGLEIGQTFELKKNRHAKVVGVFSAGGSSYESEVWVDLEVLRTVFRREGVVSSVHVLLDSPASFDAFRAVVEQDKRLGLLAMREVEYFEKQSEGTSKLLSGLGSIIAFFFAIGAMIGAMITMYAAVANRQREIGTLRALGFPRWSILFSFLLESVSLAIMGGLVGVIPSLLMGFVKISMMNFASWSEIVFEFRPTPEILIGSVVLSGFVGLIGGFFPAVRAARVSAVTAMRA
ncbi:ABC transporter permease [Pendulispora albinea]|uniref:FtsX-like permease family protein n=1 Tax=Pendulispora albinea TaxID=2741071 RepID=A0ABZ2LS44_9BACT